MKKNFNGYSRTDKTMHIMERFYTEYVIKNIIGIFDKIPITPNMITIFNMILSILTLVLAYEKKYISVAVMIQIYVFLDNLDGILARYKNMQSRLGANLDIISDTIFYNCIFIIIGIEKVNNSYIILSIILLNLYGVIAKYYIVPRLKNLKFIKRDKIKAFFLRHRIILGMNVDTASIIMSICLIINQIEMMYILIIVLFLFDIIYRIIELKYNEFLQIKNC